MSFVADFIGGAVETLADFTYDLITFDIPDLVDTAVGIIEGIVHTVTHPTEDPIATIMLAVAAYGYYNAATASAAVSSTAAEASAAAIAKAQAAGMTAQQVAAAGQAAATAVTQAAAGASTIAASTAPWQAVSGPMFDAAVLGSEVGISMATSSTAMAAAGVTVAGGLGSMEPSSWAATSEGALRGASAVTDVTMAGPSLSLAPGAYGGVGAGSAAGSMVGWGGGGGITAISTGNLFLDDLKSVWTDTDFAAPEDIDFATDYAESEAAWGDQFVDGLKKPFEAVQQFGEDFYKEVEAIGEDPWGKAEEYGGEFYDYLEQKSMERYKWLDPESYKLPTSTDELIELGVDAMAEGFANWSPTISYQAGGDPGSATSESYPSFTRAETGILGDPFNLEGQDLALTVSGLASQLQQQRGLPFGQQEMGMAPTFYDPTAFRQRQAPAEELKQLMDPSYAVNQYQQPMVNEMINQLNANAQVRGLAPSAEGVSRGVAPLLSKLRQDNLSALNRAAGLDLEATRGAMGQRAGDITAQQGYQDIGLGADVARKNITLNSLLALAQMSKPTIIGGTTQRGSSTAATPGTVFSGSVPVGNILSTGWNWLTDDDNQDVNQYGSSQLGTALFNV